MDPIKTEVVVIGAGPGGYAAAFYAADLGRKVILVEQEKRLGGVCLNRGCIPSKALLHATELIPEARHSEQRGITFEPPKVDLNKLRAWKESILTKLSQGVAGLAQRRGVQVMFGRGYFEGFPQLARRNRSRAAIRPVREGDHRRRLEARSAQGVRSRNPA
jgi:dihydrolipoamide dehydrogenase